ncbi:MAG TPA: hypothetical protein DE109_04220 [Aeromonas sp.]|nr:hypothetical protein [Aeromonas sp.]
MFCLATNEIAQTGLSSLPPVIYYSEQLFRLFCLTVGSAPQFLPHPLLAFCREHRRQAKLTREPALSVSLSSLLPCRN